jgi:hypothetical protein
MVCVYNGLQTVRERVSLCRYDGVYRIKIKTLCGSVVVNKEMSLLWKCSD